MTTKQSKTKALAGVSPFIAKECPQPRKPARRIEEQEQITLMSWARRYRIQTGPEAGQRLADYLHAIPNGGGRSKAEAGRLKASGVLAGVSDLHLPLPRGHYHGLWIELKAPRPHPSSVSTDQRAWLQRMRDTGHRAEVCYGADAAHALLLEYLGG